jgi:hypothetical protein
VAHHGPPEIGSGIERPGETVFRFRTNGRLYTLVKRTLEVAGEDLSWVVSHTCCRKLDQKKQF